jgi:parvulin-like peptidyl-prolyl isomerase
MKSKEAARNWLKDFAAALVINVLFISVFFLWPDKQASRGRTDIPGVAQVGSVVISEDTFRELLLKKAPSTPEKFTTLEQKEALLKELIRKEAIYAKALSADFDKRPEIVAAVKQLVCARFQEHEFERFEKPADISETDVIAFYQANLSRFATEAAVNGAVIYLRLPPKSGEEQRVRRHAEAEAILKEAAEADVNSFRTLVARHSDDQATRYHGGSTGWISAGGQTRWEPEVLAALHTLESPGHVAPILRTERGLYIIKLVEKRLASVKPLDQVRETIRYQLARAREEERKRNFDATMIAGLDIRIDRKALEGISAPAIEPPREVPATQIAQTERQYVH